MSYGDLIKELHQRSGMGVKDYAEAIDLSTTHLSNIINGAQPGSRKILESALDQAGMKLEDLQLPEPDPATKEEKDLLRWFRALTGERRALSLSVLKDLYEHERVVRRLMQK